jgi:periplasmic protein TonB
MFEDSTFDSTGAIHTRSSRWMMATFALNGTILLAFVLLPLFHPEALSRITGITIMEAPPPPEEPRPQPMPTHQFASAPQGYAPPFQAPTVIPRPNPYAETPDVSISIDPTGLAQNGNPIGSRNDPFGSGSSVRVVAQQPRAPAPVSQGVMNGLLLFNPVPVYPPIAIATRTGGTVVLAAIISKTGAIENLRVVSGPAMLQQAALDAVRRWRYRPYTLNGQPVEVETTVNVVFKLD